MRDPKIIVARARGCIGVRFRPHGRDPAFGLDCVGLAAHALRRPVEQDYAVRTSDAGRAARAIDAAGLARIDPGAAAPGDLVLLRAGPTQLHLAILTPAGFVHTDAGLRRVVETPGRPADILGAWRAGEG